MALYKFKGNSHTAKRLENKFADKNKFRWLGAAVFEKEQLVRITGVLGEVKRLVKKHSLEFELISQVEG